MVRRPPFVASAAAHEHCLDLVRRFDYENFLINVLLPRTASSTRRAHAALRALNVELVQVRSKAKNEDLAHARITFFRSAITDIADGMPPPRAPMLDSLAEACGAHPDLAKDALAVVDARAADLAYPDVPTLDKLTADCRQVHGTLALATLRVLGGDLKCTGSVDAALSAGSAAGLAVVLRSVPYHAASRLSYMPDDVVAAEAAPRVQLLEGGPNACAVFRRVADAARAESKRARSFAADATLSRGARPALWGLRIADIYLSRLARAEHNPFDQNLQASMRATYPLALQYSLLSAHFTGRV